ncbi:MAG: hypothetical protein H0T62_06990 [Parachlamydiaceae bacterium]|nr:hypothetical protein [Parachlamydiaceae bacterium]
MRITQECEENCEAFDTDAQKKLNILRVESETNLTHRECLTCIYTLSTRRIDISLNNAG